MQVSVEEEADDRPRSPVGRAACGRCTGRSSSSGRDLGLEQPVDLGTVAAFLRLEREPAATAADAGRSSGPAVAEALASLQDMRAREGKLLARTCAAGPSGWPVWSPTYTGWRGHARPACGRAPARAVAALPGSTAVDPGRLAQEVALLADRLDVSEELARLDGHRARLEQLLGGAPATESLGRTLEFLVQELAREIHTLGVKAQDVEVSALVIEGKAELEKIREQAQNIE